MPKANVFLDVLWLRNYTASITQVRDRGIVVRCTTAVCPRRLGRSSLFLVGLRTAAGSLLKLYCVCTPIILTKYNIVVHCGSKCVLYHLYNASVFHITFKNQDLVDHSDIASGMPMLYDPELGRPFHVAVGLRERRRSSIIIHSVFSSEGCPGKLDAFICQLEMLRQ